MPGRLNGQFDVAVVFVAFHGQDLTVKRIVSAKVFEQGGKHSKFPRMV
jgi:hypothetical protein